MNRKEFSSHLGAGHAAREDDGIEGVALDLVDEHVGLDLDAARALDELLGHHRGDRDLDLATAQDVHD